jgi:uncharacterized protein
MTSRLTHQMSILSLLCAAALVAEAAPIDKAWQKLPAYRVGEDRACVLQLDAHIAQTAKDAKQKQANAQRLAAVLAGADTTDDARLFICTQLARIGGDPEVPAVATLLNRGDKRSTQMACVALSGIDTETARAALRDGLHAAKGDAVLDLLEAVATVRDSRAVDLVEARLKDAATEAAALNALGEIATTSAANALLRRKPISPALLDARLRCADRLARQRGTQGQVRHLYESALWPANPVHYRAAALRGLTAVGDEAAAGRVVAALRSSDPRLAGTAALLLPHAITKANVDQALPRLTNLPPEALAQAIAILAEHGCREVLPLVTASLDSEKRELRVAAVRALGHLGNAGHVKTLAALAGGEKEIGIAALRSLAILSADGVDTAIAKVLAEADGVTQSLLIPIAAQRRIKGISPTLLAIAEKSPDHEGDVYTALAEVGTPGDCPALLKRLSADMNAANRKTLEATIAKLARNDTSVLTAAWTDAKARPSILRILARCGGTEGLKVVRDALGGGDTELRKEAIRALSSWSDAAAVDELLGLARTKDDVFASTMAVRGLMALVDRVTDSESRLGILDTLASLPGNSAANDWAEKKRAALSRKPSGGTGLKHMPARSEARKKELAKKAPEGYRLVAYIDCGPDRSDGAKGKPTLQVKSGAPFMWAGAERHGGVYAATVVYSGTKVEVNASGLDPKKSYKLGLTWWDYDHNARIQTVSFAGKQVLKATKLPSYKANKAMPATLPIDVPGGTYQSGKMPIAIGAAGGVNVVLSEIWLYESGKEPKVAKPAPPKPRDPNAKRILLITGEDYKGHKWQLTAPALHDELAKDARFAVDRVDDLATLKTLKLDDYAAIVMHFKNYDPEVPGRAGYDSLASFVEKGGGLVLVHFACGAFQEFKDEFVKVGGRVWNPKMRGHDPFGTFAVEVLKPDHPALAGLKDFETTDELYTCLDGETPIEVLATAVSKVDKKVYPMVFVLSHGKGRVFHSPLGHDVAALRNEPVAELFRRGTAWVAGLETSVRK